MQKRPIRQPLPKLSMQQNSRSRDLRGKSSNSGFSVLELMIVVTIALILAGFGMPKVITMMHTYRLRGTGTNLAGLIQTVRWRAVQDSKYYSMRFTSSGTPEAYADLKSNSTLSAGDPQTVINSEVTMQAVGSAPSTSSLKSLILPTGSTVTPLDGYTTANPVTFGQRGLPCVTTATNGGSVCNSAGGTQAYWIFFQDQVTQKWGAVTVTPAGRIQVWYYEGAWGLNQT